MFTATTRVFYEYSNSRYEVRTPTCELLYMPCSCVHVRVFKLELGSWDACRVACLLK